MRGIVGRGGERYELYDFCLESICGPRLVLGWWYTYERFDLLGEEVRDIRAMICWEER